MELDNLKSALMFLRDNAYLTFNKITSADACKGTDWYITNGQFTRAQLDAHKRAAEWLGKHRAYNEVLELLSKHIP